MSTNSQRAPSDDVSRPLARREAPDMFERPAKRARVGRSYQADVPTAPSGNDANDNPDMAGTLVWSPNVLSAESVDKFLESAGLNTRQRGIETLLSILHTARYNTKEALSAVRFSKPEPEWSATEWDRFATAHTVCGFDFDAVSHMIGKPVGEIMRHYYQLGGLRGLAHRRRLARQQEYEEQQAAELAEADDGTDNQDDADEEGDQQAQQGEDTPVPLTLQDTPLSELPPVPGSVSEPEQNVDESVDLFSMDSDPLDFPAPAEPDNDDQSGLIVVDDQNSLLYYYD